jgi:FkbM family methyltransferase
MNRLARRAVNRLERTINRLLVPEWRHYRIGEEETLGRVLRDLDVDCVFDVGANDGGYGMMLRDYCGYEGRIISFEPTPDVFAKLAAATSNDRLWDTCGYALGRTEGTAKFQVHEARTGSSFLPVTESESQLPGNKIVQEVNISVRTLNVVFPALQTEFGFKRPFLKMDTQGYDMEVFSGALDVVGSFVGLQSELSVVPFYKGAPLWLDSLKAYERAGFVLAAFVPNNADAGLYMHEVDCIMTRR